MKWLVLNTATPLPEIILSGYIDAECKVNYGDFKAAIDTLKANGVTQCKLIINSGGGDMIEGLAIYDAAKESGIDFKTQVVGMAASMASILMFMGTEKPTISKHARVMLHRPKSYAYGESDALVDRATQMNNLEATIKGILKSQTGKTEAEVAVWFVPGKETWFSAEEALAAGLVSEIVADASAAPALPEPDSNMDEQSMWNKVYNQIDNKNNFNMKYTVDFKNRIGLKEDATDAEVEAKLTQIQNRAAKADELEASQKADLKAKAKKLIDNAITNGVATEAERVELEAQAEANYDFVEKMLNKAKKPELPLNGIQNSAGGQGAADPADRSKWNLDEWAKNDFEGLAKLQIENKEEYTKVCKRSGVTPTFA